MINSNENNKEKKDIQQTFVIEGNEIFLNKKKEKK